MAKPINISSYAKLIEARSMFMSPIMPLALIIIGNPGLGKTQAFKRSLGKEGEEYGYISGNTTAFDVYRQLWEYRNKPIIIDDVDDALTDSKKRTLLKNVMESERIKTARWGSASNRLKDEWENPIPTSFTTTSNFCIIVNRLEGKTNQHLAAVLSRAYVINFVPSAATVHEYVGSYFDDFEVYSFVEQFLPVIGIADVRDYENAQKLKYHKQEWQSYLLNNWINTDRDFEMILRVMNDRSFKTAESRAEAYVKLAGPHASIRHFMERENRINQVRSLLITHGLLKETI